MDLSINMERIGALEWRWRWYLITCLQIFYCERMYTPFVKCLNKYRLKLNTLLFIQMSTPLSLYKWYSPQLSVNGGLAVAFRQQYGNQTCRFVIKSTVVLICLQSLIESVLRKCQLQRREICLLPRRNYSKLLLQVSIYWSFSARFHIPSS